MAINDYAPLITGGLTLAGVGVGGWITYKLQSRIAAQNIATQHELAAAQREQALFDRRAAAYTNLISVLLREPSHIMSVGADEEDILALRDELIPWRREFVETLGPIHVYGTPALIDLASWAGNALSTNIRDIFYCAEQYQARPPNERATEQAKRELFFEVSELCIENAGLHRQIMEALRQDLAGRYTAEMAKRDIEKSNEEGERSVAHWEALRNQKPDASTEDASGSS